jgi:hypothetical protein
MENTNTIQFQDDQATFFLADGQSYKGPFNPSEIYSMIESKQVSWVDYCYREKEGAWVRIADHPVFKVVQAEPPKPKPKVAAPPPPPQAAPAVLWFVFQNDTQTGPYSTSDVARLLSSNQIQSSAFVWQEKFTEWKPLNQVDDFKNVSPSANAAPSTAHSAAQTPEQKKAEERRTAPRKPLVAQTHLTNLKEVMTGLCRDISVGGMQVLCETVPGHVGETIRLNVLPPASSNLKAFVAEGVIVRVLEDKKGFSFRFTKLNDEAKAAIERYIS